MSVQNNMVASNEKAKTNSTFDYHWIELTENMKNEKLHYMHLRI